MNINILRYSLFGIAGGQEVDLNCCYCQRFSVHLLSSNKPLFLININVTVSSVRMFPTYA